jgi:preprotein translocase subunit SecA
MNNFEARKRLLDYDDVMNQQREVVYDMRLFALEGGEDLKGEIWEMIEASARQALDEYVPEGKPPEKWDLAGLRRRILLDQFVVVSELPEVNDPDREFDRDEVERWVIEGLRAAFHRKIESLGPHAEPVMSFIMLSVIDDKWKDHLYDLDHLKASISFRGWGQKDPLVEYKQEAYTMFVSLMGDLRRSVAQFFFRAQVGVPQPVRRPPPQRLQYSGPEDAPGAQLARAAEMRQPLQRSLVPEAEPAHAAAAQVDELGVARSARTGGGGGVAMGGVGGLPPAAPDPRTLVTNRGEEAGPKKPVHAAKKPGRNDPCPCGSGKKYKQCCGR